MKLIIMRHGEADTFGLQDRERCLTPNGIEQAFEAGGWLSQYIGKDKSIDFALVSTFTRAEQTYVEVNKTVPCKLKDVSNDIIPESDPHFAHDYIRALYSQHPEWEFVLLVSHMPFVSYFLEEATINKYSMLFDTSSMVVIDYDIEEIAGLVETVYHPH